MNAKIFTSIKNYLERVGLEEGAECGGRRERRGDNFRCMNKRNVMNSRNRCAFLRTTMIKLKHNGEN